MKSNVKIVVICIIVFLILNFLGGFVVGASGQTKLQIAASYGIFAIFGAVFGIIYVFVNKYLTKIGK